MTENLIDKTASLGGSFKKQILKSNIVCFNNRKHSNRCIYDTVETLERALMAKKKASFYYFDRDENAKPVYRKDKARYIVEPMALVYSNDNYYLMTWNEEKENPIVNYRLDRMDEVEVAEEKVSAKAIVPEDAIASYTEQVFFMYGGEPVDVTLGFGNKMINQVQDKFGEETNIIRIGSDQCVASVKIQKSPSFYGWLFQYMGDIKLLSPESLIQKYKEFANKVLE